MLHKLVDISNASQKELEIVSWKFFSKDDETFWKNRTASVSINSPVLPQFAVYKLKERKKVVLGPVA